LEVQLKHQAIEIFLHVPETSYLNWWPPSRQMAEFCMQFSRWMWINLLLVSDRQQQITETLPQFYLSTPQHASRRTAYVWCALWALLKPATSAPSTAGSSAARFSGCDW